MYACVALRRRTKWLRGVTWYTVVGLRMHPNSPEEPPTELVMRPSLSATLMIPVGEVPKHCAGSKSMYGRSWPTRRLKANNSARRTTTKSRGFATNRPHSEWPASSASMMSVAVAEEVRRMRL